MAKITCHQKSKQR